jgi:hypothetical protein
MEESVFLLFTASAYSFGIFKFCNMLLRRVWRYQRDKNNP